MILGNFLFHLKRSLPIDGQMDIQSYRISSLFEKIKLYEHNSEFDRKCFMFNAMHPSGGYGC